MRTRAIRQKAPRQASKKGKIAQIHCERKRISSIHKAASCGVRKGTASIVRLQKDGKTRTLLVDRYEGKRLNRRTISWRSRTAGSISPIRIPTRAQTSQDLDFSGLYRVNYGMLQLLDKEFERSGLASSRMKRPSMWGERKSGATSCNAMAASPTAQMINEVGCDGMKVDTKGNIYCAMPEVMEYAC